MTIKRQRAKTTPAEPPIVRAKTRRRRSGKTPFLADKPSMAEPALGDLLRDPIMQHLMRSDGVEPRHLLSLLDDARTRLFS
jgi:hypothetical protein